MNTSNLTQKYLSISVGVPTYQIPELMDLGKVPRRESAALAGLHFANEDFSLFVKAITSITSLNVPEQQMV